jgi:hypothetical protein
MECVAKKLRAKEGGLMQNRFNCPECASDSTKSAQELFESGISTTTGRMSGIGVGTGGKVSAGIPGGKERSQSDVVKNLSPPAEPRSMASGVILIITGLIIFVIAIDLPMNRDFGIGILLMLLAGGLAVVGYKVIELVNNKRASYDDKYAKWEGLWYCTRCGHTFYIE